MIQYLLPGIVVTTLGVSAAIGQPDLTVKPLQSGNSVLSVQQLQGGPLLISQAIQPTVTTQQLQPTMKLQQAPANSLMILQPQAAARLQ